MRGLADAAVEGLLVSKDQIIVTANRSFMALVGVPQSLIAGRHLLDFFDAAVMTELTTHLNTAIETDLIAGDGSKLPVEVILREVDFSGRPHQAVAVRDLSARRSADSRSACNSPTLSVTASCSASRTAAFACSGASSRFPGRRPTTTSPSTRPCRRETARDASTDSSRSSVCGSGASRDPHAINPWARSASRRASTSRPRTSR